MDQGAQPDRSTVGQPLRGFVRKRSAPDCPRHCRTCCPVEVAAASWALGTWWV